MAVGTVRPPAAPPPHDGPQPDLPAAVQVHDLTKRFGPATVLDGVDLILLPGEIHGLMGQNGSGKSTLVKILSGVHAADRGSVSAGGRALPSPIQPADLERHGLAFVHQDLGLVEDISILENIRVGRYEVSRLTRRIAWDREGRLAEQSLERLGTPLAVQRPVGTLPAGQRAVVAVARALQAQQPGEGCIIFDESTQSLPREALPRFYEMLRAIAATGTAILIVSHRLEEVMALADRVTVLRDGRTVAEGMPVADLTEARLSELILGRQLSEMDHANRSAAVAPSSPLLLSARVMRGQRAQLGLDLRAGEVVGVTGGSDTGLDSVPAVLSGETSEWSGEVTRHPVDRHPVTRDPVTGLPGAPIRHSGGAGRGRGAHKLRQLSMAVIPQHRLQDGLAGDLTAVENLTLPRIASAGRLLLRRPWQLEEFADAVTAFGITPNTPKAAVATFSGGNQQKLLLAKWMTGHPDVVVAHEPTQAVDVGARVDILRALRAAADAGAAVLLCSIETEDLAAVCDRVLVLRPDAPAVELADDLTPHTITAATYA